MLKLVSFRKTLQKKKKKKKRGKLKNRILNESLIMQMATYDRQRNSHTSITQPTTHLQFLPPLATHFSRLNCRLFLSLSHLSSLSILERENTHTSGRESAHSAGIADHLSPLCMQFSVFLSWVFSYFVLIAGFLQPRVNMLVD